MPDIGEIGRGLLKGALSATEKAAEKVKDAAGAASRKLGSDDEPDTTKTGSDTTEGKPGTTQAEPDVTAAEPDAATAATTSVTNPAEPTADAEPELDSELASGTAPASEAEPAPGDEAVEHADPSEVRELVEMFQQLLASKRPPAGAIQDDWSIGVGDLLAQHPKVPKRVRGLVGKLNRFGGLAISPTEVAFDGDDVPWEKVTEVRTRNVVDYLVGDAVRQQVESLPVPWFPGRGRVLDALGQALLTVTIATVKDQLEKLDLDLRIPAEIGYRASFGRSKELGAGVVTALVLADPAVNQSLVATAAAKGIPVTAADDELLADAGERAAKVRAAVATLEAELDRFTGRFGRNTQTTSS